MLPKETFEYKAPKFRGFPFDFENPEVWELYEKAQLSMQRKASKPPKDDRASTVLARDIQLISEMFDDIFGKGAGQKILGKTNNRRQAYAIYNDFLGFIESSREECVQFTNGFVRAVMESYANAEEVSNDQPLN